MEYSRVGVPLKTGRSFVSPSYSQAGRREEKEGGDMSNKVFLLLSPPIESEFFARIGHIYLQCFV